MKKESKDIIKENEYLELSNYQTLSHFSIFFFLLIAPLFFGYSMFKNYEGGETVKEFISISWFWILLAIVFYFIQKRRLRFREVEISYTNEEFEQTLKLTSKKYKWRVELNDEDFLVAYRAMAGDVLSGEMITIIKGSNKLFLNSICDPTKRNSLISFGWNEKNIETFISNLGKVKEANKNIDAFISKNKKNS